MKKLLILCGAVAMISACQTMPYQPYAREVKKKPGSGGVIALKAEHVPADSELAASMMKGNCGTKPVKVLEEGEVAVGQTTTSNSNEGTNYGQKKQVGTLFGLPVTSGSDTTKNTETHATTTAVKEWQITYECEVAAAEPAKPAGKAKAASKKN